MTVTSTRWFASWKFVFEFVEVVQGIGGLLPSVLDMFGLETNHPLEHKRWLFPITVVAQGDRHTTAKLVTEVLEVETFGLLRLGPL